MISCRTWSILIAASLTILVASDGPALAAKRKICDQLRPEPDIRSGRFYEDGRYYEIPFVLRCRNGAHVNRAEIDSAKLRPILSHGARQFCRRTGGGLNKSEPGSRTKLVFLDSGGRVVSTFWLNNATCKIS